MKMKLILSSQLIYLNFSVKMLKRNFGSCSIRFANSGQFRSALNPYPKGSNIIPVQPKNMILRHCSPIPSITTREGLEMASSVVMPQRPLTIILAWMLAQEKHLQKYRNLWFRRGFDVLTVRTSPFDLLFPSIGGQIVAKNLLEYLTQLSPQYNEIVIHAFSVGGYQFGEILLQLQADAQRYHNVADSIRGVIIDSMVHLEEAAPGLSRAITENFILLPLIKSAISSFLSVSMKIGINNYPDVSNAIFNNYLRCPSMLMVSRNDRVSDMSRNDRLAESWSHHGMDVQYKCWNYSNHVLHYHEHPGEYEHELDLFLKKLKLKNSTVL